MSDLITILFTAIASGTIILYATIGEIITERSGILNLGVEGMMLMGAFFGYFVAYHTGNLFLAILGAAIIGGLMGLIHAFMTITIRANQVVSGLALTMFGTGISAFFGIGLVGKTLKFSIQPIFIPILSKIPIVGEILFKHNILVYFAYVLPFVIWFIFAKTKWGLALKSSGEEPLSSEIMGIHVIKVRYIATIVGGMLIGISGAYLSVAYSKLWVEGMTAGRGWITIALVIFANWNPLIAYGGAYLFGGLTQLGLNLQKFNIAFPIILLKSIPYIFTLLFLLFISLRGKRSNLPKSLGLAYFRENRE
ncbi:MAG: ABC transporter permease [Candidatus Cloacimonetes bacterium]|jgi:general nucleoside transport system permease protein|nr:ABC transporter permease [Candidatus Cloacimonadota bacterium]MBT7468991.1 ABC transporter permease [Candidatus Cloacimonadota bacterium]